MKSSLRVTDSNLSIHFIPTSLQSADDFYASVIVAGVHCPVLEDAVSSSSAATMHVAWWDFQSAFWHLVEQYWIRRQLPHFLAGTRTWQTAQPGFAPINCGG